VLGEAAGGDVVLQQLLGEVLVHLGRFVGVHGVPQGLVQVCKHSAVSLEDRVIFAWGFFDVTGESRIKTTTKEGPQSGTI